MNKKKKKMWYVVWRTQKGDVGGFIEDDYSNPVPKSWKTKEEAQQAMRGHILEHLCELIEI